ncbi:MAG: tripartite tricarboxylate transporter substrate binding protein [Betaproteobacteria bacterium]|jgi:tripartite-type tricarboxylate transporter receptor subunit TctC|nr:tripartite tricarboxylate transporter substrate binding protein [Betaproteobacteria bacterium]
MKITQRIFQQLVMMVFLVNFMLAVSEVCSQTAYPIKPIKIIVGFAPGSSSDVAARVVGDKLGQILGQSVIVENRPGGSSSVAAKQVSLSPPDGYTLFLCTVANVINTVAKGSSEVDLYKDLSAVSMIGSVPNMLVVHPSLGANTVNELTQLLKAKPGEIAYASAGNGTALHMAAMLFSMMADVKMIHVPYQGSNAAMSDLLAGRTTVMFVPASTVMQYVNTGKLKALASTGLKRTFVAPDIPTLNEQGLAGFESTVWFGLMSPLGTPEAIEKTLNKAIDLAILSPEVQTQFKTLGIDSTYLNNKDFLAYIKIENDKWAKVIKSSNIKLY